MKPLILLFFMTTLGLRAADANPIVPLWSGPAPQSQGTADQDTPTLTLFLPAKTVPSAPAVILCPGGGYGALAFQHEGLNVAKWFQDHGYAAFVLKYRLPAKGYRHPVPLRDAQRALRLVRSHAADWNVNPAQLGIMGFSAGGHLASTVETHFDGGDPQAADPINRLSSRPDFAVLVYPVITLNRPGITHVGSRNNLLGPNPGPALVASLSNETQVTAQTPPTLLVHALDDKGVPIENSRLMLAALQKAGVPSALQEYPHGGHGFGYGHVPDNAPPGWLDHVGEWLKAQGF